MLEEIVEHDPTPALRLNPDLRPKLEDIINKAPEKDRGLRYQSAAEMRADLKRLRRDTESVPSNRLTDAATAATNRSSMVQTQVASPKSAGGRGRMWIAAGAAVLLLAGAYAGHLARTRSARVTEPTMGLRQLTANAATSG